MRTYAVAYDFLTGHYGITPRAHLLDSFGGPAEATAPPEYTTTSSLGGSYDGHAYPFTAPNPIWVFSTMIAPSVRLNRDWVAY